MLRPRPREVSHLPHVAQPVTPHPPSRSSGFRPVASNHGRLTHPPRENQNQTWLRPGAFGQCLDPWGWTGEKADSARCWAGHGPSQEAPQRALGWNVRQTKDSAWCQEFYWLSILSGSRQLPAGPHGGAGGVRMDGCVWMSNGSRNLHRGQRPEKETGDRTEQPQEVPPPDPHRPPPPPPTPPS